MIISVERRDVIRRVAGLIPALQNGACARVAVDGPDASGKTMFANELAAEVQASGRPVVRVSLDDFHNPRAIRYQYGRESPEGYWQHAFNYPRFRSDVLEPFRPGGTRLHRPAAHDLATDAPLDPEPLTAAPAAVLIVDGLFLQRDELVTAWDLSVFLDVPFAETARRMAMRDGTDPDPAHPSIRRYVEAQRIYFEACTPHDRADVHIDNQDLNAPRIIRP
ncbi:uridine kinase [Micromonospora phaseoli]|uniref:Uridine kinase n=1 Tax=Micromonospora phaseoli TaxID=1144548 RepID=A0A1H7BZN6_9ACTN|nr:uridine kinase [Micromonospora phaseoli]PZV92736.1 uridine kinase [Micromonospora phaseoli]GIJ76609.1 uridine kinase [Micromonospora phaseoli]SEJ82666.1 uridine kinase [Micromonospora phaseoli]